jgi:hypothetical protein
MPGERIQGRGAGRRFAQRPQSNAARRWHQTVHSGSGQDEGDLGHALRSAFRSTTTTSIGEHCPARNHSWNYQFTGRRPNQIWRCHHWSGRRERSTRWRQRCSLCKCGSGKTCRQGKVAVTAAADSRAADPDSHSSRACKLAPFLRSGLGARSAQARRRCLPGRQRRSAATRSYIPFCPTR